MNERKLTKSELAKREDIIMKMKDNKRALVQKYGKDAEQVMYGRATNLAKKESKNMDQDKLREMIKDALQNPKAADLNKDGKLSDYEEKRGAAIEKAMVKEWGGSDQFALIKSMHRDLGEPTEFPGLTRVMAAAEDATDFYMDDFEEFDTEREDLIMSNARSYARKMFPDFMSMAAKMVEPSNINRFTNEAYIDRFSPKAYAEKIAAGTLDIEDAMEETGYPYTALMTLVKKIKASASNLEEVGINLNTTDDVEGGEEISNPDANVAATLGAEDVLGLEEGASTEEKRIAMRAIKSISKLRSVSDGEARQDLIRAAKEIGDLKEDLDLGHQDNEPGMLKAELYHIGSYAMELYKMMDNLEGMGEEIDLPAWWQSKITTAKNMISGAKHYLEFEVNEPQIDAMVDVASEEDVMDESVNEGLPKGFWDKKMDAKDEVKETLDDSAFDMADSIYDAIGGIEFKKAIVKAMSTDDAKLYLSAIMRDYALDEASTDYAKRRKKEKDSDYPKAYKKDPNYSPSKDKKDVDESYNTLVNKIKKQGKSEKAAKAIAGAVASYKAKGGGKGPTAKQK